MIKKLGIGCGGLIVLFAILAVLGGGTRTGAPTAAGTQPAQVSASAAPAAIVAATIAATAVAPTATPVPTAFNFATGKRIVPTEVPPGTYRMRTASAGCYWERLSGLGGTFEEILANGNPAGPEIVTVLATDKGFNSTRCAVWSADLSAITSTTTAPFGAGTYQVGIDIAPGTWRSTGGTSCYWERTSGFGGGFTDIIANDNAGESTVVTIGATDKGFDSTRCGTWTKIG